MTTLLRYQCFMFCSIWVDAHSPIVRLGSKMVLITQNIPKTKMFVSKTNPAQVPPTRAPDRFSGLIAKLDGDV